MQTPETGPLGRADAAIGVPESADRKRKHCRTNSRRGQTNQMDRSYPPVVAACRALQILKVVNRQGIATISSLYTETGIPRPTIVRMLETLMSEDYVVRDNMCGGYRVTQQVAELSYGYSGISRVIEVARPLAIGLTRQIKWPIGLGVLDDDAIAIQYWTGTISPWAHTNTVLGNRPDLCRSAMGRAYVAFCGEEEREHHIATLRRDPALSFDSEEEEIYRNRLEQVRRAGYAVRDPRTEPLRMTTFGVPIIENGRVAAVMSVSFYSSAVPHSEIAETILNPLMETRYNIEHALDFLSTQPKLSPTAQRDYEVRV